MRKIISYILSNSLIILGLCFLAIKVLDWYNPLMNFSGQTEGLQIAFGICAIVMGIFNIFTERVSKKSSAPPKKHNNQAV